ncbi:D-hexose-6-phosphate mutarotase [Zwartia vadi]|uniref:D-hexose-6-phosphate mutarotase n=1 Tax=Zwartia vadi TaxID=3058168 RepID=UPI0025B4EADE|nr:D-hexose-6-phosphate mutarotase [Zwartia vadi]MDN3988094.1 D-hexose-6-phosphate mutarotase [Zwartia vadi]
MSRLNECINRYGNNQYVQFEETQNGIVLLKIDHPLASATISIDGGQVLSWHPKSQQVPVLWGTQTQHWLKGRAIRAGVPVCWPWFGAHPTDNTLPSHGYARLCPWELTDISTNSSDTLEIYLSMLPVHEFALSLPFAASLTAQITVGESLSISLMTENTGEQSIKLTEALHAYFFVSDIASIQIEGLEGCEYIDLIDHNRSKTQQGLVSFSGETGRVYQNTTNDCLIRDMALNRSIRIQKNGSLSTVVWNPWLETAKKMDDLGPSAWREMVCLESANALDCAMTLEAGAQHTLAVRYSVEA